MPNITSENARVQRFQSCLPPIYKDKVELMKPKNLKEAIRKVECCYNHIKQPRQWKDKMKEKNQHRQKAYKPPNNINKKREYHGNNF